MYSGIDIQYTTGVQLYRYTVQYRCSGVHVYKSTGVQLIQCTIDVQLHICTLVQSQLSYKGQDVAEQPKCAYEYG